MMRSLYSGVSGLKNHQTRMDVVGNNIANVNTTGYKKSTVTFQNLISQNLSGAAAPTGTRGGINAKQIGLGVTLASIGVDTSTGTTQYTGAALDMAIEGEGYFVLQYGNGKYYTRAGTFDMDSEGNIISTNNGYKVMGWMATNGELPSEDVNNMSSLKVPAGSTMPATATTKAAYSKNLDASAETFDINTLTVPPNNVTENNAISLAPGHSTSLEVYDSLGNTQNIGIKFIKSSDSSEPNTWYAYYTRPDEIDDDTSSSPGATKKCYIYEKLGKIEYNNDGTLKMTYDAAGTPLENPDGSAQKILNITGYVSKKVTVDPATGSIINIEDNHAEPINLEISVAELTQYAAAEGETSTALGVRSDGYAVGTLESISTDSSGTITGTFSNGRTMILCKVALATFNNPGGLNNIGGSLFTVSNNSGEAQIGAAGSGGRGSVAPSTLEMSNVNLSDEFTDMIVTQRGFQANSRVITVSDTFLEELINLKR